IERTGRRGARRIDPRRAPRAAPPRPGTDRGGAQRERGAARKLRGGGARGRGRDRGGAAGGRRVVRVAQSGSLKFGGVELRSRLIVGTGKYPDLDVARRAIEASGASMVTVAVRRVDLSGRGEPTILDLLSDLKVAILPNTAGCYTADEAVRVARLGREAGLSALVKVEVIGDEKTLLPDNEGLLQATRTLVKEGFVVLPYTNDDLVVARRLRDAGAAAVMPLGAPIGSGLGIQNAIGLRLLNEAIPEIPVIVDAGVGTASDAAIAMELGADGVLMNTGIAAARDPVLMAKAMKKAVEAGREAFLAGRMPKKLYSATPSSPTEGKIAPKAA